MLLFVNILSAPSPLGSHVLTATDSPFCPLISSLYHSITFSVHIGRSFLLSIFRYRLILSGNRFLFAPYTFPSFLSALDTASETPRSTAVIWMREWRFWKSAMAILQTRAPRWLSGVAVILSGNFIEWGSTKQPLVALATCQAEINWWFTMTTYRVKA